jgi:hypothetical protein
VLESALADVSHSNGSIVVAGASARTLTEVIRRLDDAGLVADNIRLRRPTLDDVFIALTRHRAEATR